MRTVDRLVVWLVAAFVLTAAFAALFVVSQQMERLGANDAGWRLASEVAASPTRTAPTSASARGTAQHRDLAASLEPFYVVYDRSGHPLAGTGYLDGALATVPTGVLDAAATRPDTVTWQPEPGLRFATVAIRSGAVTVLAGQSLAPSEARTDRLLALLAAGWFVCVLCLVAGATAHLLIARRVDPR